MIKLTVNPNTHPIAHAFEKSKIVIGSGQFASVDLSLPNETLQPVHVIIEELDGYYTAKNQANDPFVTINGLSFGKRKLQNLDILQIGQTTILFETTQHALETSHHAELEEVLAAKIQSKVSSRVPFPHVDAFQDLEYEKEMKELDDFARSMGVDESLQDSNLDNLAVDELINQIEELEQKPAKQNVPPPPSPAQYQQEIPFTTKHNKGSLKDYYLSDLDDEQGQKKSKTKNAFRPSLPIYRWNWKLIGSIAGTSLAILLIIAGLIYLNMSGKHDEEEIRAAQGVADVAMALTSAHIHPIQLQNQNWADPDFIRNNLTAVLASQYNPAFTVDSHGQLGVGSYLIRIYTSSNLSQFLVIAQPAPSLLQWFLPKASLLVDSDHMELRKVNDLKVLNRLLLNPQTLDSTNTAEISRLVLQGELFPLSHLYVKSEKQGFNPPKVLASIRPGAENLVYNAPRYYRFGEDFMKEALAITGKPSNSFHDHIDNVELLQVELQRLAKFPNLVLYSSHGLQWAIQAQRALNTFVPHNKLLVAYLKFSSKGSILSSHLLMDEGAHDVAVGPAIYSQPLPASAAPPTGSYLRPTSAARSNIDMDHPIYVELCSVKDQQEQALKEFENDIQGLLNTPNRPAIIAFIERMETMLKKGQKNYIHDEEKLAKTITTYQFLDLLKNTMKKYDDSQRKNEDAMIQALVKLYMDNSDVPLSDFLEYIKAAGLDDFVKDHLALYEQSHAATGLPQKHIEDLIQNINKATNLAELNDLVDTLSKTLNLERFPNSAKLITYQNDTRGRVLEKLNEFLFSSDKGLPKEEFKEENRGVLAHIMKSSWVTDPDEFDYFINEFEIRSN